MFWKYTEAHSTIAVNFTLSAVAVTMGAIVSMTVIICIRKGTCHTTDLSHQTAPCPDFSGPWLTPALSWGGSGPSVWLEDRASPLQMTGVSLLYT